VDELLFIAFVVVLETKNCRLDCN